MQKIGTEPRILKPAEGEAVVAIVRAMRRARLSRSKLKPVSQRRRGRRSTRRPLVANVASVPESTSSIRRIDVPAAHEVSVPRSFLSLGDN